MALILSGLYVLSYVSHYGIGYLFSSLYDHEQFAAMSTQMHLMVTLRGILSGVVSFAVAIWLYRQAKRANRNAFVWLLLGLCLRRNRGHVHAASDDHEDVWNDRSQTFLPRRPST